MEVGESVECNVLISRKNINSWKLDLRVLLSISLEVEANIIDEKEIVLAQTNCRKVKSSIDFIKHHLKLFLHRFHCQYHSMASIVKILKTWKETLQKFFYRKFQK